MTTPRPESGQGPWFGVLHLDDELRWVLLLGLGWPAAS